MPHMYAYCKQSQKTALIVEPKNSAVESERFLPMLSWADWKLLQEIKKERAPSAEGNRALMDAGLVKGEVQQMPFGNILQPVNIMIDSAEIRRIADETAKGEIAELQDQIKDWEAKCKNLEQAFQSAIDQRQTMFELKNKYLVENEKLSKSLQQYRNAFFTDQRDSGGTIPCPPVLPAKGA